MIALCPCYIYISFSVFIYAYRAKKRGGGGYRTSHEEIIFIYIMYDQVFYDKKRHRKPSNKQVDCTVSTQTTALFRATNFFQKESHLLFYQLIKVYSYEPPLFSLVYSSLVFQLSIKNI